MTHLPRYTPFEDSHEILRMGAQPVDDRDWIEIDERFAIELREKAALLATRPGEVFRATADSTAAQTEVLRLLVRHLPLRFPETYRASGEHMEVAGTGIRVAMSAEEPALSRAGRLVQEDLCLLQHDGGAHLLVAASLCAPSYWKLADKIGRPLVEIHDPVPGYVDALAPHVERFLATLRADRPVWRTNWSISRSAERFRPGADARREEPDDDCILEDIGRRAFLRVERQTFRRLPATGSIVFTIRVYVDPLATLAGDPARMRSLAAALRSLSGPMRDYKGLESLAEPIADWLEATS